MTEIEKLELEISEKKALLKKMKEEANPKIKYDIYHEYIREKYSAGYHGSSLTHALRNLALVVSTAKIAHPYDDMSYNRLLFGSAPKLETVSVEKIAICNQMISDIFPIFEKYVEVFSKLNS